MAIADMQGVTNNLNKMADQIKDMYEQSQNGHVINSEDIANIEKMNREIQDLVKNSRDAKEQLAGTMAELGKNFSGVIEGIQSIKNNNPTADISRQLDDASSKISQFIGTFQQLSQTKLEINADNLKDVTKLTEDARKAIEDMHSAMSNGANTSALDPILNNLRAISDVFKDGNVSNQINATADAMGNLNRVFGDQGQVMQTSSMSIKALGDQMNELSKLTNTMNSGLTDVFAKITGPGTDVTPFTVINEQIKKITDSVGTLQGTMKNEGTWNTPENLGDQTRQIEAALQQVMGQQQQAFSQALGKVSSSQLEDTLKDYNKFRDQMIKNISSMQDVLSDPTQLPEIPADASKELIEQIEKARANAQKYLTEVHEQLGKTKFSGLQDVYNQSVQNDFSNIMGQGGAAHNDQLMRMATGQSLGNNFDHSMSRVGSQTANIYNKAMVLDSAAHDSNSGMTSHQRNAVDYHGVANQAQELARMQAEYANVKDQFSGSYSSALNEQDPGKREEAMNKAKERYESMIKMQNKVKDHAINMGRSFKVSSPEDKERLGKDVVELYNYVRSVVKDTADSSDSLFSMGKAIGADPKVLAGLKDGTNGIKDMRSAMDDAAKSSENLWSSMQSGMRDMMSPLKAIGKGLGILGIGTLGGGPLAMLTKSLQYHSEQGRDIYESQRTGLQYGLDGSYGLGNTVDRLHKGAEIHQRSGGRIGTQELNKAYDSAMGSVGGRYGVSAEQGSSEMNSLVNNTFMMQKMYGIDQGTMNDAYKTFYKDMGQSADEAANSIAKLTQTAAAANIPAGQYLKMVSGIAQQFMKIGLNGKDAENMMGNFIHQGMRAEVAQSMTQQTGQAMGNFANNKSMTGFATAMMGGDPFEGMASALYSHEANGKERDGWGKDVAKMMDTMTNQMNLVTGGDPRLQRVVMTDHFKDMGYDQRGASTLTSAFMSGNHEVFQKALEKQNERKDNPNGALEEVNNKLSAQLDKIAGNLSEQDKLQAKVETSLYELAFKTGPSIDEALRKLEPAIMKFVNAIGGLSETIANCVNGLVNNPLFQNIGKPVLEAAAEHPIAAAATTVGLWKMARGKWSLPNLGGAGGPRGGSGAPANIIKALAKNPKTAAFAVGAGILAYNSIGSAHSRDGDVNERTYDKLHAIHQTMLNGEMNLSGPGGYSSASKNSSQSGSTSMDPGIDSGSSIATLGGMLAIGATGKYLDKGFGIDKLKGNISANEAALAERGESGLLSRAIAEDSRALKIARLKSFGVTAVATEAVTAGMDIYDHKQKGDLMQGDANRVGANAAVNLGYMGMGAAIGSIVPGVGTVAGGIAGGLFGLGVDAFGNKDANGKGFNDRAKDVLYSMSTGGDTLDDLEHRRQEESDNKRYGFNGGDDGSKIKAKLQMMGYSDKEAEEMSKNLIENKDTLEEHGVKLEKMTLDQKAFMAEHMKKVGLNSTTIIDGTKQSVKAVEGMKDLASAIRNTEFGNKVNKDQQNREQTARSKVEAELDDKGKLSTHLGKKEGDLRAWKEKLVEELKANPEDRGKVGEIADVDNKLEKLTRAQYLLDNGEDQRREDHGASYDKLSWWQRGGQSRDEFINNQLATDKKDANEMRGLYGGEYADNRIAEGAFNDKQAAENVENAVTNPGGKPGTNETEDRQNQKADDSRRQASNSNADKVVKQNQKQEELNKEANKLSHTLIDQEKMLFKALEASGNNNTKQLHTKLEEIRKLLDKIQFNTVNMGKGGGYGGSSNSKTATESLVAKKLKGMGYDDKAIAAIMGNIKQESNFSTKITEEKLDPKTGMYLGGGGLFQFTGERLESMKKYAASKNLDPESLDAQLGYMHKEVTTSRTEFSPENFHPDSASSGASQWGKGYEVTGHMGSRLDYASQYEGNMQKYYNGGSADSLDRNLINHNHDWNQSQTDTDNLRAESKYGANLLAKAVYESTGEKMMVTGGAEKGIHSISTQGIGHEDGWKLDVSQDSTNPGTKGGDALVKAAHDAGYSIVWENDHWDINFTGKDSRDKQSNDNGGNGTYTASQGSTYEGSNNVEAAAENLAKTANGQPPSSQTNIDAAAAIKAGTNNGIIGDARSAMNSKTGKAFYDGTMIQHHMGGVGVWYGNQSGNKLNWDTMQAAIHEAGGAGNDIGGHRQWAAQSREARLKMDAAAGVTVQNPVTARNAVTMTPINADLAKDMAKNIEAQNIPTTITNSNVIQAASGPKSAEENAGKEISVNITIDKASKDFVDGFGDAISETVRKLGARVNSIEQRTTTAGRTARQALNSSVDQKQQAERDKY